MGFTTGFTGGVTLTLSLAYLTVLAHERNRTNQALALRSQSRVLHSLLEPTPLPEPRTRQELAREERSTLIEAAKDRWNAEIENGIRWVQRTDWTEVRENVEGSVARVLGLGLEKGREGVEKVEEKGPEVVKKGWGWGEEEAEKAATAAVKGAKRGWGWGEEKAEQATTAAIAGAQRAGAETRAGAGKVAELSKENLKKAEAKSAELKEVAAAKAEEARRSAKDAAKAVKNSGVVDTARSSVRDAVQKGIEKGKELAQKAGAAVGLAEEMVKEESALEKALRQRLEGPSAMDKTVEEALEERYRPIEARDNTELRGV